MAAPLEKPVSVTHGEQTFNLSAADAELHADLGGMVDEAVAASRPATSSAAPSGTRPGRRTPRSSRG